MANYKFINNKTKEATPLQLIDAEICKDRNEPVDEIHFSLTYNILVEVGMGILLSQGGDEVTKELYEKWLKDTPYPEEREQHWGPESTIGKLACKYLFEKYTFRAWR